MYLYYWSLLHSYFFAAQQKKYKIKVYNKNRQQNRKVQGALSLDCTESLSPTWFFCLTRVPRSRRGLFPLTTSSSIPILFPSTTWTQSRPAPRTDPALLSSLLIQFLHPQLWCCCFLPATANDMVHVTTGWWNMYSIVLHTLRHTSHKTQSALVLLVHCLSVSRPV